jgi:outer membrane protein OmpA-like peptidoglycan-associated protein
MEQLVVLSKARLVCVAVFLTGLAGCSSVPDAVNPISWYSDVMGVSKNDDLAQGQNDQNLKEGANEPYPNLGNVPDAPDTAMSSIDRDKLVNSLVADRDNAKYSGDDLRAGRTNVTAPPPAPPAPASPPAPAAPPQAAPQQPAKASPPPAAPAQAAARPAPPVAAPETTASAAPTPTQTPPAPPPATSARRTAPARGSEAPPKESALTSPTVNSVPEGEAASPAPPPPQIGAPSHVASAAPPPATKLKPPSAAKEASVPTDAPSAPTASRHAAISYQVADVAFTPGSALLGDKPRSTIADIVKLHQENGGSIRIVGHAEASGANAAVTGLNLALDRAQAVAVALIDGGVPAQAISVEAAPVAAKGGRDVPRAEVYLEN